MRRKFLLLAGVMAMLLVSAAPAAQAKTVQFELPWESLESGYPVEMKNFEALKFGTALGTFSCNSVVLKAKVGATKTDPATLTGFGTSSVSGCSYGAGTPFTAALEVTGPMKFASGKTGELPVKFSLKIGTMNCTQSGTLNFAWTNVQSQYPAYQLGIVTISSSPITGNCFGTSNVTTGLELTTTTGTPVKIGVS